jgi:hypothetical protein
VARVEDHQNGHPVGGRIPELSSSVLLHPLAAFTPSKMGPLHRDLLRITDAGNRAENTGLEDRLPEF